MLVLDLALGLLAILTLVPAVVFALECLLARTNPKPAPADDAQPRPRAALLVPAHNESTEIRPTVEHLLTHMGPEDLLLVVADNCSDDTAAIAREAGATVVERSDPDNRGKGFALHFGFDTMADDPPDVVVVVDADCRLDPGSLETIVRRSMQWNRPVQAEYLMTAAGDGTKAGVSAFAFMVRNQARPRGLDRLGLPCHLGGTGMAFPWHVLQQVEFEGDQIVEDMVMGIDLADHGFPVRLCSEARVWSELPEGSGAAIQQRSRWEHGHLHTITTKAPKLIMRGLSRANADLVAIGLDLAVPPLALLVIVQGLIATVTAAAFVFGASYLPFAIAASGLTLVGLGVMSAWFKLGRQIMPWYRLLAVPGYVLWKIPIYVAVLVGKRTKQWNRTQRAGEAKEEPSATDPS